MQLRQVMIAIDRRHRLEWSGDSVHCPRRCFIGLGCSPDTPLPHTVGLRVPVYHIKCRRRLHKRIFLKLRRKEVA